MTLLTIIQDAATELSLNRPNAVISASDQQTKTMLALANREGYMLSRRYKWTALITEATHTTVAAELQGVMTTIAPGFRYMISDTFWLRDQIEPINGGLSPQAWQYRKAIGITGPYPEFRIQQGNLYFMPVPEAGLTAAFEYMSDLWCESSAGTGQNKWANDQDVGVLDEDLMLLGIKWRYLRAKGMDYAEERVEYENAILDAATRDGVPQTLSLAKPEFDVGYPTVPVGNWQL